MKITFAIISTLLLLVIVFFIINSQNDMIPTQPDHDLIRISASCNGQDNCQFQNEDLNLVITLTNISSTPIAVPVNFLQQQGPSIKLVNQNNGNELQLPTNPANLDLLNNLTIINPNETASIQWIIKPEEVEQIANGSEQVSAEIAVVTTVQIDSISKSAAASTRINIQF